MVVVVVIIVVVVVVVVVVAVVEVVVEAVVVVVVVVVIVVVVVRLSENYCSLRLLIVNVHLLNRSLLSVDMVVGILATMIHS